MTELLKVHGVAVSFIGVNTSLERVDGYLQTPYEFYLHDVNHSRRKHQFACESALLQNMQLPAFCKKMSAYILQELTPLFCIKKQTQKKLKTKNV